MNGNRQESGNRQSALKKAYEISYAVFRIASRIGNVALKEHLERQALALLDAAAVENYAWVSIVSRAIEYLIRFGTDVGVIHEANKEVILNELRGLDLSALSTERPTTAEEVALSDIFSPQEPLFRNIPKFKNTGHIEEVRQESAIDSVSASENYSGNESGNGAGTGNALGPEIRQSAIMQKLRESGNCRMRDLQSILPNYSERTLRYDLQTLTERNLVERVGSGGPSVYYRLRQ